MTPRKKSYDPRCSDLASIFLSDEPQFNTPEHIDALAQDIQDCIEGYIYDRARSQLAEPRP
jgi:hypothetical protein